MTLQEAKEQAAKELNFKDWADMCDAVDEDHISMDSMEFAIDRIVNLLSRSSWEAGAIVMRKECAAHARTLIDNANTSIIVDREGILSLPIPEFKA